MLLGKLLLGAASSGMLFGFLNQHFIISVDVLKKCLLLMFEGDPMSASYQAGQVAGQSWLPGIPAALDSARYSSCSSMVLSLSRSLTSGLPDASAPPLMSLVACIAAPP